MSFLKILAGSIRGMVPGFVYRVVLPLIPFLIAEQLRPVGEAPRWRDYGLNMFISLSTAFLSLPRPGIRRLAPSCQRNSALSLRSVVCWD